MNELKYYHFIISWWINELKQWVATDSDQGEKERGRGEGKKRRREEEKGRGEEEGSEGHGKYYQDFESGQIRIPL